MHFDVFTVKGGSTLRGISFKLDWPDHELPFEKARRSCTKSPSSSNCNCNSDYNASVTTLFFTINSLFHSKFNTMSGWDGPKEDLGHPDSAIRLASAVHRFKMPRPNTDRKLSFARSFRTVGSAEKTRRAILQAVCERIYR